MASHVSKTFLRKQEGYYRGDERNRNRIASPGSQYLIQLLGGGYLDDYSDCTEKKVLDAGCGAGFNLVGLSMMGFEVYGCDISDDIVAYAEDNVKKFGAHATVVTGENQALPFESGYFDLLVSMNVIHYVNSEAGMTRSIAEYARVLKTGGRLILSTNHPANWILKDAEKLGKNVFRLNCRTDFRHRDLFFVFEDANELRRYFEPDFSHLKIGENQMEFFDKCLRNFVLTGIKK
ncbi:MAG: class I SAM-dependent methyltransferase [Candidatus Omnitrophota bacterium]